jgi:hypothetical protein
MRRVLLVTVLVGSLSSAIVSSNAQQNSQSGGSPVKKGIAGISYADYIIGEPLSHKNLTIFPISSKTLKNQDRYITLDEGLAAGSVKVVELGAGQVSTTTDGPNTQARQANRQSAPTRQQASQQINAASGDDLVGPSEVSGDVNKLMVVNKSGKPLYLMPGEVISGGEQDRTIGEETVIDATGRPVPIEVFCVEHGRWEGRSLERTSAQLGSAEFNRSQSLAVSQSSTVDELAKESNSGKFIASVGQLNKESRRAVQESQAQGKVWEEVGKANSKVGNKSDSGNFAENYFSRGTAKDLEPFVNKLKPLGETQQIVGTAVAVNGKMLSVDVFESTPLFRKFWPKLSKSYALDAIAEPSASKGTKSATVNDCLAFLKDVQNAKPQITKLAEGELEKHDSSKGISFSYHDTKASPAPAAGGAFGGSVHTTVLSK